MYYTFIRSCTDWKSFAKARKRIDSTNLTYDQARTRCEWFNNQRTPAQIKRGTKMEFTK